MMTDYEVGFPDGQYIAHGVDLDAAIELADAFHKNLDPQPIIERIEDAEVRGIAQRITQNLLNHSGRGKRNSTDSVNWGYVVERVRRYNQQPSDDLLYRIGTHVDALTPEDQDLIQRHQQGSLNPEQRFRVLNWIVCWGLEIEHDLALLIFGRNQLQEWLERSQQAYPDFEFFLVFEALLKEQSGLEPGICFTMHWLPKPGAPEPNPECDFPWKAYWEPADMFWQDWFPGGNQFDFNLNIYPSQESFAVPDSFCEKGDRYTTPTQQEADLMPLAVVLGV
ncbi:hypothetical protein H6F50_21275 [Coleofasciculus sp. FACHB-712]|uniref:hypothetical protein n=1 Tax=Coleofasciculus sp. FACHB-712 TaxID=2692789 RepID=UPI00168A3778|nr:hypothetical protein [Coleofasciculus sp. FACHB-712]MBD1944858.1 hypothetical protein [Coleofasciculus sp. FACHB-712]